MTAKKVHFKTLAFSACPWGAPCGGLEALVSLLSKCIVGKNNIYILNEVQAGLFGVWNLCSGPWGFPLNVSPQWKGQSKTRHCKKGTIEDIEVHGPTRCAGCCRIEQLVDSGKRHRSQSTCYLRDQSKGRLQHALRLSWNSCTNNSSNYSIANEWRPWKHHATQIDVPRPAGKHLHNVGGHAGASAENHQSCLPKGSQKKTHTQW